VAAAADQRRRARVAQPRPSPRGVRVPATRTAEAFRRVCVDVRSRGILDLYGYHRIDPPYRLWICQQDLPEARDVLNLQQG
jgi:hypothetical protein